MLPSTKQGPGLHEGPLLPAPKVTVAAWAKRSYNEFPMNASFSIGSDVQVFNTGIMGAECHDPRA
jgi:hypothetical protein